MIEESLEVNLPTIWTDEKQRWDEAKKKVKGESRRREDKSKSEEVRKKEGAGCAKKAGKSRNAVFFLHCSVFFPEISESTLAEAAGAEPARQMRD